MGLSLSIVDQRIVRVTIEVNGETKTYEGPLNIHVSGTKYGNANQNTATVKIANLSKEIRNYLLTETSPFNKNRTPKKMTIEAGRVSTGTTKVFEGDIITASPTGTHHEGSDKGKSHHHGGDGGKRPAKMGGKNATISAPPDIILEIRAQTGAFQKGNLVARSGRATENLSELSKGVAGDIGASLEFTATDKTIANYSFSGASLKQIDALATAGKVDVFQDDGTLVVKDAGKPRSNRTTILNIDTGMIGIPEVNERGIKVRFLFNPETVLGGAIEVTSKLNPSLNGSYTIYQLDFDLATREVPFYYTAQATKNG